MTEGLARGPLTGHLRAMHDIVNSLHQAAMLPMPSLVEAHWNHCREVARHSAEDPLASPATRPPVFNEVLEDARETGTGLLRVRRRPDGSLEYDRVDPGHVSLRGRGE
jgi:hypothetical protein